MASDKWGPGVAAAALSFSFLLTASWTVGGAQASTCGDGVVDAGEDCDPGSPLGAPDCDTTCRRIDFEPPGLPFGLPPESPADEGPIRAPRIYSTRLQCRPFQARDGARLLDPVRVRYRIHICRDKSGVDSFTPQQVRAVMAEAADEFALGAVLLEEEAVVTFRDGDCSVDLGDKSWFSDLVAATPPGVLALAFVTRITANTGLSNVGGFCPFFGPLCVNAGAFDTLVIHELGHFFGLAHTFECASGIETAETCAESGDLMCDTPPDRGPAGVTGIGYCADGSVLDGSCRGSCSAKTCTDGSRPDGYNWMSYYDCIPGRFSAEQHDFMRCTLEHELLGYNADAAATTSTVPFAAACGDANEDGKVSAADALWVLRAGVGIVACPAWLCDYDGSGLVSSADALAVLRAAIGQGPPAGCPPAS